MAGKVRSMERARAKHEAKEAYGDIKLTYNQLIAANSGGALGALLSQHWPGRLMQFVKFGRVITAELETLDEGKKKLIEQYNGKLNEATNEYEFGEHKEQAMAEFKELMQTEIIIQGPRLTDQELEKSSLTAQQVLQLVWLWEE